ncbi:MAG: hypothetical protein IIZ45_05745, partial [Firmicutes bacterium]|nr:hypothetical protein [Bacillota bacterium]
GVFRGVYGSQSRGFDLFQLFQHIFPPYRFLPVFYYPRTPSAGKKQKPFIRSGTKGKTSRQALPLTPSSLWQGDPTVNDISSHTSGLLKNFPKGIDVNCHGLSTFRNYYKEIIAYMTYPSKAKSPI